METEGKKIENNKNVEKLQKMYKNSEYCSYASFKLKEEEHYNKPSAYDNRLLEQPNYSGNLNNSENQPEQKESNRKLSQNTLLKEEVGKKYVHPLSTILYRIVKNVSNYELLDWKVRSINYPKRIVDLKKLEIGNSAVDFQKELSSNLKLRNFNMREFLSGEYSLMDFNFIFREELISRNQMLEYKKTDYLFSTDIKTTVAVPNRMQDSSNIQIMCIKDNSYAVLCAALSTTEQCKISLSFISPSYLETRYCETFKAGSVESTLQGIQVLSIAEKKSERNLILYNGISSQLFNFLKYMITIFWNNSKNIDIFPTHHLEKCNSPFSLFRKYLSNLVMDEKFTNMELAVTEYKNNPTMKILETLLNGILNAVYLESNQGKFYIKGKDGYIFGNYNSGGEETAVKVLQSIQLKRKSIMDHDDIHSFCYQPMKKIKVSDLRSKQYFISTYFQDKDPFDYQNLQNNFEDTQTNNIKENFIPLNKVLNFFRKNCCENNSISVKKAHNIAFIEDKQNYDAQGTMHYEASHNLYELQKADKNQFQNTAHKKIIDVTKSFSSQVYFRNIEINRSLNFRQKSLLNCNDQKVKRKCEYHYDNKGNSYQSSCVTTSVRNCKKLKRETSECHLVKEKPTYGESSKNIEDKIMPSFFSTNYKTKIIQDANNSKTSDTSNYAKLCVHRLQTNDKNESISMNYQALTSFCDPIEAENDVKKFEAPDVEKHIISDTKQAKNFAEICSYEPQAKNKNEDVLVSNKKELNSNSESIKSDNDTTKFENKIHVLPKADGKLLSQCSNIFQTNEKNKSVSNYEELTPHCDSIETDSGFNINVILDAKTPKISDAKVENSFIEVFSNESQTKDKNGCISKNYQQELISYSDPIETDNNTKKFENKTPLLLQVHEKTSLLCLYETQINDKNESISMSYQGKLTSHCGPLETSNNVSKFKNSDDLFPNVRGNITNYFNKKRKINIFSKQKCNMQLLKTKNLENDVNCNGKYIEYSEEQFLDNKINNTIENLQSYDLKEKYLRDENEIFGEILISKENKMKNISLNNSLETYNDNKKSKNIADLLSQAPREELLPCSNKSETKNKNGSILMNYQEKSTSDCDVMEISNNAKKSENTIDLLSQAHGNISKYFNKKTKCRIFSEKRCGIQLIKTNKAENEINYTRQCIEHSEEPFSENNKKGNTVRNLQNDDLKGDNLRHENEIFGEILISNANKIENTNLNKKELFITSIKTSDKIRNTHKAENTFFSENEKRDASCQTHVSLNNLNSELSNLHPEAVSQNSEEHCLQSIQNKSESISNESANVETKNLLKKSQHNPCRIIADCDVSSDEMNSEEEFDSSISNKDNEHVVPRNEEHPPSRKSVVRLGLSRKKRADPLHPYLRRQTDCLY